MPAFPVSTVIRAFAFPVSPVIGPFYLRQGAGLTRDPERISSIQFFEPADKHPFAVVHLAPILGLWKSEVLPRSPKFLQVKHHGAANKTYAPARRARSRRDPGRQLRGTGGSD